jgi:chromosome segregation ATPase
MVDKLSEEIKDLKRINERQREAEAELNSKILKLQDQLAEHEAKRLASPYSTPVKSDSRFSTPIDAAEALNTSIPIAELEEMKSAIAALEASLDHKSSRCDDLASEVNRLRTALTAKADELDEHRAQVMRDDAELRAQLIDKAGTIEVLQELLMKLEIQAKEGAVAIDEYSSLLNAEREQNKALNDILTMIQEKDVAAETMLKGMAEQRMAMSQRLVELESQLQEAHANLKKSDARSESLMKLLSGAEADRDRLLDQLKEAKTRYLAADTASSERLGDVETITHGLHRELLGVKMENDTMKRKLEYAESQVSNLADDLSEAGKKYSTLARAMEDSQLEASMIAAENERLKRDLDSNKREIENLIVASAAGQSLEVLKVQVSSSCVYFLKLPASLIILFSSCRCNTKTMSLRSGSATSSSFSSSARRVAKRSLNSKYTSMNLNTSFSGATMSVRNCEPRSKPLPPT